MSIDRASLPFARPALLDLASAAAHAQTFAPPTTLSAGTQVADMEPGDFDGDGDLDFDSGGTAVVVFWSNGDLTGTFSQIPSALGTAAFGLPAGANPNFAGLTVHHASLVYELTTPSILLASDPVALNLVP